MIYLKSNKLVAPYPNTYQDQPANDEKQIKNIINYKISIEKDKNGTKRFFLFLFNLFFTFFFITPLVVIFWTSSWDIIYLYIFPKDFYINILITFIFSNCGLFLCYLFQHKFTRFHFKLIQEDDTSFYNKAFYFRSFYTYILTVLYVCSWKTYWDLYTYLAKDVNWFYMSAISIIAIFSYRFILKKSLDNFTKTVPFFLVKDTSFNDYFLQPKIINVENRLKETLINFFYYEVIEMLISTYAWKGIWDMFDSTENLVISNDQSIKTFYSCFITGFIGFLLLVILILLEHFCVTNPAKNIKFVNLLCEINLFLAYLSLTAVWRSYWSLYDYFVLDPYLTENWYIIVSTHVISFLILSFMKCGTSLYGIGGSSLDDIDHNYDIENDIEISNISNVKTRMEKILQEKDKELVLNVLTKEENGQEQIYHKKHKWYSKFKGISYCILAGFLMSISSILIKKCVLFNGFEQGAIRYFFQLLIMIPIIKAKKLELLGPKTPRIMLTLRGFFGTIGLISLYCSFKLLDPSDSYAILNSNMILICILARIFLGEKLTIVHLFALVSSILGVFFISQPTFLFDKQKVTYFDLFNRTFDHEYLNTSLIDDLNKINCASSSSSLTIVYVRIHFRNKYDESILNVEFINETLVGISKSIDSEWEISNFIQNEPTLILIDRNCNKNNHHVRNQIIGICAALLCTIASSFVSILIKKLSNSRVHYSLVIGYAGYIGLPVTLIISCILLLTKFEKKDPNILYNKKALLLELFYSIASAVIGVFAQVLMNFSIKYYDASKISMLRSMDVLFAFLLQFLVLKIYPNIFSTIGAFLIFTSVIIIFSYNLADKNNEKKTAALLNQTIGNETEEKKQNLFKRIFFYKF